VRAGAVLVALLLCIACIPFPHRSYRTPVVHGRVTTNAAPIPNLPLRVIAEPSSPCDGKRKFETVTNANGEFAFCPMPVVEFFLSIGMAHRIFHWNACANVNGQWVLLNESQRYTLSDAGPREIEHLDCDLAGSGERCRRETDIDITPEKLRAALGELRCAGVRDP
jgi:hypothetical protein